MLSACDKASSGEISPLVRVRVRVRVGPDRALLEARGSWEAGGWSPGGVGGDSALGEASGSADVAPSHSREEPTEVTREGPRDSLGGSPRAFRARWPRPGSSYVSRVSCGFHTPHPPGWPEAGGR